MTLRSRILRDAPLGVRTGSRWEYACIRFLKCARPTCAPAALQMPRRFLFPTWAKEGGFGWRILLMMTGLQVIKPMVERVAGEFVPQPSKILLAIMAVAQIS